MRCLRGSDFGMSAVSSPLERASVLQSHRSPVVRETHKSLSAGSSSAARGRAEIPDEIAFLAGRGVPLAAIVDADARARQFGVCPVSALFAGGEISDLAYYRCLAERIGAPFVPRPPAMSDLGERRVKGGVPIIAIDGGARYLIAPEGVAIRRLFALWRAGRAPIDRLAITTPRRLAAWTSTANARRISRDACEELRRYDRSLSAATPAPRWMGVVMAVAPLAIVAAMIAGGALWMALSILAGLTGAVSIAVRLLATAATVPDRPKASLSDASLPTYSIIVPLYREAPMARRIVAAIERLDYPSALIEVKLVIEDEDDDTRRALEVLRLPPRYEIVIAPPGGPRTKPRALNVALKRTRGDLIVVFDAEDTPARGQLRLAASRFAAAGERLACLQARLAIDNTGDGWLAALFGLEYAALFDVLNPGLAALGAPMMLGGTSNHFRAAALRRLHGWDAWNVTEDADLGMRLARFGYRVETIASTTHEEAPARASAWLSQRRRWIKGWLQTLMVHGRDPARLWREMGFLRVVAAMAILATGAIGPLAAPFIVLALAYGLIEGDLLSPPTTAAAIADAAWIALAIGGAMSIVFMYALGACRRRLGRESLWLLALPAYHAMLSIAAWGAVVELWRRPFEWSKTEHGLARSSRMSARRRAAH